MTVEAVICHIRRGNRILLQKKASGLFGEGKWNGVGGKLDDGESPLHCVVRETEEESGLQIESPKELGSLQFFRKSNNNLDWLVHVYLANRFKGRITRSREGELRWFNVKELPFETM
jgi:8-oxo-dGTP diphosphatase